MKITSTNLPRVIKTLIFGALALSCGAVSIAADNSDVPQGVVKFGDLNLSNPQGAATLYSRIAAAAERVCGSSDYREFGSMTGTKSCVHKAIKDAVTKVDRPALYAVYNPKNKASQPIIIAAAQTR